MRISSFFHLAESHNAQKGVEDAQIMRFCPVETEVESFLLDIMEKGFGPTKIKTNSVETT